MIRVFIDEKRQTLPSQKEIMTSWEHIEEIRVSVVIHAFNHERFISKTIEGVLHQKTNFRFELVVHDDASSDATLSIVSNYQRRYPKIIRVIAQAENQMSQGHRPPETTFFASRGEFLALCEGDDFWIDPNKLQKQLEAMSRHPKCNLCVHGAYMMTDKKSPKVHWNFGSKERVINVGEVFGKRNQFAPTASYFFRKSSLENMPCWFYDDPNLPYGDFFIEAILGRSGIVALPDLMSVYRRGTIGSHTSSVRRLGEERVISRANHILILLDQLVCEAGIEKSLITRRKNLVALDCCLHGLAQRSRVVLNFGLSLYSGNPVLWWYIFQWARNNRLIFRILSRVAAGMRDRR